MCTCTVWVLRAKRDNRGKLRRRPKQIWERVGRLGEIVKQVVRFRGGGPTNRKASDTAVFPEVTGIHTAIGRKRLFRDCSAVV